MKTVGLRSLYQVAPFLTEDVVVLHDRRIIGRYSPIPPTEELIMEETIRKAIEPDQVKERRGRLTKGLGEVPGLTTPDRFERQPDQLMRDAWSHSQPVPKKK